MEPQAAYQVIDVLAQGIHAITGEAMPHNPYDVKQDLSAGPAGSPRSESRMRYSMPPHGMERH